MFSPPDKVRTGRDYRRPDEWILCVEKWTNLTDSKETASNTADGGVNTDYPLFRLADVYLMIAEAFKEAERELTRYYCSRIYQ